MKWIMLVAMAAALAGAVAKMPIAHYRDLPTLKEMDDLEHRWVQKRLDYIPEILKKYKYDAWLISMREFTEDPVFRSLVSSTTTMAARRRTVYLFHTNPDMPSPKVFVGLEEGMWSDVLRILRDIDPERIAVNVDKNIALADGLSSAEADQIVDHLGAEYMPRVSSDPHIAVETIAYRAGGLEQLHMYRLLQENVWAMIQQGFSEEVVEVGKTTATDLEWWFRDVMRWRFGVGTWFHPTVTVSRHPDEPSVEESPEMREGDMLHVDIGISTMNMATDTQHLGYILRANETSPPQSLIDGLHNANKMQDLVRKNMLVGKSGNDVLRKILSDMKRANLRGLIYSHPIGDYVHSAGASIGLSDEQGPNHWGGQMPIIENYWQSVELGGITWVPEWQRDQRFNVEEDVYWDSDTGGFEWVFGQQTEYHLVQPKHPKHGHGEKHKHGSHGPPCKGGQHGGHRHHDGAHIKPDDGSRKSLVQVVAGWAGWAVGRWM